MSSYENIICEAMEMIAEKAVAKANYDKTIQASIIRCEDELLGQYKVRYQDSTFYAYAANTNITYSANTLVYILVPGNDLGNTKTILGTVKKMGADYITITESAYEVIGTNCIMSDEQYELCSYTPQEQRIVVYDRKKGEDNNIIIDNIGAKEYFKETETLKCGAIFKTALESEQQFKGNYGVHFELAFKDNATGEIVLRDYILDINNVEGNPYKLNGNREQFGIFELDGTNFEYINMIEVFCYGFPVQEEGRPNDIFISKLNISGVKMISKELLDTQCLTILTPQGAYFDKSHLGTEIKSLEGQVRIRGKVINNNFNTLKYFWFIENTKVDIYHEKYNRYGGAGWACLNEFEKGDWKPGKYRLEFTKTDNPAKITRYKCVVLYNDLVLSRVQEIQNLDSEFNISIVSDGGTKFYYDNGTPILTCLINGKEETSDNFTYIWAEIDNNNQYKTLIETVEDNEKYKNAEAGYSTLLARIEAEQAMAAASQQQLDEYKKILNEYNKIQRVEKNKIYKIQMNEVVDFKTFKCSVYNKDTYIGTASIVLTNSLEQKDEYTLVINNGTQVFKYDENGISPSSPSLLTPMKINPLSFTVYNPSGIEVDINSIDLSKVTWSFPIEDTMLDISKTSYGEPVVIDGRGEYYGYTDFNYGITNRYNLEKTNNDIVLTVNYKDILLTAKTNFTFTKDGEPGTNGTDFVCKIVPNTENMGIVPMLINGVLNYEIPKNENQQKWFKVQLWENGILLNEEKMKNAKITWSILANNYRKTGSSIIEKDSSKIIITNAEQGYFSYDDDLVFTLIESVANIIKCIVEYEDVVYYAILPLITIENKTGTYKIKLKENTGFQNVLYSADGQKPSYSDEFPFELEVLGKISNTEEDLSELKGEYGLNYNWSIDGKIYNNNEWTSCNNLKLNNDGLKPNQAKVIPEKIYNGECVTNALRCVITTKAGGMVGIIHIPIYMSLNRYGNAAINGWDGNSVSIDKDGCGVILAPQIGAGKKEEDNSFTGMIMGQVREAGKINIETGLFGYKGGERTLFLNAEDGSAIFGKGGKGQITIDPNNNKALLYSHDFWKNYGTDGKPSDYNTANQNNKGMLIDLSTPEIKFGNGSFYLHDDGNLYTSKITATGGTIGGWKLESGATNSDYRLYQGNVGMAPFSGKYYAFWAGNSNSSIAPFRVGHDGKMIASSGTIGGWTIGSGTLTSNNGQTILYNNGSMKGPNWEINSSGVATFNNVIINNAGGSTQMNWGNFKVDTGGSMTASNVNITGTITATGGSISGSLVTSGINAGNITGGSMSMSRISGGTLNVGSNGGFLRVGIGYTHPEVSGLNVRDAGINMYGNGIENLGGLHVQGEGNGITQTYNLKANDGSLQQLRFKYGILVASA